MSEWQPIETAPRDAWAKILGWCVFPSGAEVRLCQRKPSFGGHQWMALGCSQNVTHWMPLPSPPQPDTKKEGA